MTKTRLRNLLKLRILLSVIVCLMIGTYFSSDVKRTIQAAFSKEARIKMMLQMQHRLNLPRFRPVNHEGDFYTLSNVCIENTNPSQRTAKIVVYSTMNEVKPGGIVLSVAVTPRNVTVKHRWAIHVVSGPIPSSHTILNDTAAYFVVPTFPGNLYHFWTEEFVGLWNAVYRTGRLVPGADNHILYVKEFRQLSEYQEAMYSITRYESILQSLYVAPRHDAYWMTPTNTCFTHGVFGAILSRVGTERDVIEHVRRHVLQGDVSGDQIAGQRYVTIIARRTRKILNIDELVTAARQANISNVRAVDFDSLSVSEQMRVAAESSVMVGVNGAGLHWSIFMPANRSTVIEIGWPARHWGYFYDFIPSYDLKYKQLSVDPVDVHVNWTSYEFAWLNGCRTNTTERQQIIKTSPRNIGDNVWKWADVVVNVTQFVQLLGDSRH